MVAMRAARPFSPVSPCMEAIYDTAAQQLRISPVHLDIRHMNRAELLQVGLFYVFFGLRSSNKASAWRISTADNLTTGGERCMTHEWGCCAWRLLCNVLICDVPPIAADDTSVRRGAAAAELHITGAGGPRLLRGREEHVAVDAAG
jgi:hypothetical protein